MKRGETVTTPQKRKNIAMEGEKQTEPAFTCSRLKIETLEQNLKKKKNFMAPFLWMGFNCLKATATSRRQFTFYHSRCEICSKVTTKIPARRRRRSGIFIVNF